MVDHFYYINFGSRFERLILATAVPLLLKEKKIGLQLIPYLYSWKVPIVIL